MADDVLVRSMRKNGQPVTRENYIALAWPEVPVPWLPEHEAELPEELQDWSVFEGAPQA